MKHKLSVLQNASRDQVRLEPYPYIVIENALPPEVYARLERKFPKPLFMGISNKHNNRRWNYPVKKAARNWFVDDMWKEFLQYHASREFFDEVIELFQEPIMDMYGEHFPTAESLRGLHCSTRGDSTSDGIVLDAMISGNTPVVETSSVRTTHVDRGDKLFTGLLYMRPPYDMDSQGGELTINKLKPEYADREITTLFDYQYIDEGYLAEVNRVQYKKNTLVLMINSLHSIHGVTPRQPTKHPRLFVNLVGELPFELYQLPKREGSSRSGYRDD